MVARWRFRRERRVTRVERAKKEAPARKRVNWLREREEKSEEEDGVGGGWESVWVGGGGGGGSVVINEGAVRWRNAMPLFGGGLDTKRMAVGKCTANSLAVPEDLKKRGWRSEIIR